MKIKIIFIAVLTIFVFTQCDKDEKCIEYHQAAITMTNTPTLGEVNKEIPIIISFGCFNGCGQFDSFEESKQGNVLIINVIAKYEGCACTQDAPTKQATYLFETSEQGVYYLKFKQNDNNYLIDTLIIE